MSLDPKTLNKLEEISRPEIVLCLAPLAEADGLAFGGSSFEVDRVTLGAEKPEVTTLGKHESYVTGLARSGSRLVSGSYDKHLMWWDLESGTQLRRVPAHEKWIRAVAADPQGRFVVSVADDMVGRVWDVESGQPRGELTGHAVETPHHYPSMLYAVAVSPDGEWIATGDRTGEVIVWNAKTLKIERQMSAAEMYTWDPRARRHSIGGIRSLAFSPDGASLAVGGMGKVGNIDHLEGKSRIEVFDWRRQERSHLYGEGEFKGLVESLAFSEDGQWLISGGGANDGFVSFHAWKDDAEKPFVEHKAPMHVHQIHFDSATAKLTAVGHGRIVRWQIG
jgi:WD40 repeat protein